MEDDLEAFEFIQDLGPIDDFLPAPTRSEKAARGKRKNIVQEKQDESRELQQYVTMAQFDVSDCGNSVINMAANALSTDAPRPRWNSKAEYLLACMGFAMGMGAVWRFPYLAYSNKGSLLIPYFVCSLLFGFPMFVLESALGQQLQVGFLRTWRAISSRLVGLGVSSCILSVISSTYINVLVAWSLFYLGSCFTYPLPYTVGGVDHADSARKYWTETVLQKGHDMTDFRRGMNWSLFGAHLVAWSLTAVLLCTGFLGQKRTLLVTGVVPAILLSMLLVRAVTLPGARDGLVLFLKPSWESVFSLSAWTTAASQMFFGLGIGWGALINFASFNPMRNNFYKDAAFVVSINAFAAMLSGTIFFAIVGYMAHASGLEVDKVARAGTGSPFLVFSVGVGQMPLSSLFALCFWSMMAFLGLVSQYQTMEVVMTALVEIDLLRSLRRGILASGTCAVLCVLGLLYVTPAGIWWMNLTDAFTGTIALFTVTFIEVLVVVYVYEVHRFADDCYQMTGKRLAHLFRWVYQYMQPFLQSMFLIFALMNFAFAQVGQFVENQPASPHGAGCGDDDCNSALTQGVCDLTNDWCVCAPGFGGLFCENGSSDLWCPENCNGVGLCRPDAVSGIGVCQCYSEFYGASCHGERYASGWKSWAHLLGWLFSFASLVPIPLMLMSSTFRRSLKRRLDATSLFRKPRPLKPVNPHEVAPSRFLGFMLDESSEDEDEEVEISEKLDPT